MADVEEFKTKLRRGSQASGRDNKSNVALTILVDVPHKHKQSEHMHTYNTHAAVVIPGKGSWERGEMAATSYRSSLVCLSAVST